MLECTPAWRDLLLQQHLLVGACFGGSYYTASAASQSSAVQAQRGTAAAPMPLSEPQILAIERPSGRRSLVKWRKSHSPFEKEA